MLITCRCNYQNIENKHLIWFKVAVATWLVNECSIKISLDIRCFNTSCVKTQIHCNGTTTNETAVDNFFEVKLDMDELCQFGNCRFVHMWKGGSSYTKKAYGTTDNNNKKLWNKQKRNIMLYLLMIVMQETVPVYCKINYCFKFNEQTH
jgi:hypothetical protein